MSKTGEKKERYQDNRESKKEHRSEQAIIEQQKKAEDRESNIKMNGQDRQKHQRGQQKNKKRRKRIKQREAQSKGGKEAN